MKPIPVNEAKEKLCPFGSDMSGYKTKCSAERCLSWEPIEVFCDCGKVSLPPSCICGNTIKGLGMCLLIPNINRSK